MNYQKSMLSCSFCGSRRNDVRNLMDGPSIYICDGCVDQCFQKIESEKRHNDLTPFLVVQEQFTENFLAGFLKK